ncbi:acyltransferase [Acidiluteibacter ferrifornacis]|uniref:Acyltransferase n=1 Tax=Acidiluteibacter ferrifornacis TaxID=2692424 RepID=A0A6N9NFF3_9FLAO|nr:DapH/DapD/GlmU-related protein [Acidiluteibacter ferrifornacis]NBG65376.1 acyltransferase [Acidiluteibacter ferrifornacis]
MGLKIFFFKWFGQPYYKDLPFGLLVANWFFQRILLINSEVPFLVNFTSRIKGYKNMQISKDVFASFTNSGGLYVVAFDGGVIKINERTIIAPNVVINNANHDLENRDKHHVKNIIIGSNCWIGANSVILGGTVLGNNVTVAAGSVVNKEYPDNVVIGGVPAKVIKTLK